MGFQCTWDCLRRAAVHPLNSEGGNILGLNCTWDCSQALRVLVIEEARGVANEGAKSASKRFVGLPTARLYRSASKGGEGRQQRASSKGVHQGGTSGHQQLPSSKSMHKKEGRGVTSGALHGKLSKRCEGFSNSSLHGRVSLKDVRGVQHCASSKDVHQRGASGHQQLDSS